MATLNIKNLPDALYERLRNRAQTNHRSITQEVTHILSEALEEPEPLSLLELQGLGKEIWADTDAADHVETERGSWD
ncbi:MAG: Arc family DNA-binding protein [Myxococcota bacterium]|jgi:plasmid stability protein|nr:Arc family DNA-binding protein [Myxococcota bacterium]